jgi:hypothetical protein
MKIRDVPYVIDRRYLFIVIYLLLNAVLNVIIALFAQWYLSLSPQNLDISASGVLFSTPPLILFAFVAILISRKNSGLFFMLISIGVSVYIAVHDRNHQREQSIDYADAIWTLFYACYPIGAFLSKGYYNFFNDPYIANCTAIVCFKLAMALLSWLAYFAIKKYFPMPGNDLDPDSYPEEDVKYDHI